MRKHKSSSANNKSADQNTRKKPAEKRPKKISETYLHNSGLYYLQRYAASSAHFKSVMMRKVKKSCLYHTDQDFDACAKMVNDLVEKFIRAGLLNDEMYTRTKVTALRQRGKSKRSILAALRTKGISSEQAESSLDEYDQDNTTTNEDAEYQAALTHARKKRLGPYRQSQANQEADIQKELAKLARAGFSYDTARKVLDLEANEVDLQF